jgi:serine/threonine protein kinase
MTRPKSPLTLELAEELTGLVIDGRYRLDRPIGTGGMATVWEAMHLTLSRRVAVKFIDSVSRSRQMRDRFLREARVAAAVHHRNVVDIVDFGTTDDGRPFMVMELLRGRPLSQRMAETPPLGVADIIKIMARILSGLGAVHDAGIVHRDLKPENVFLVHDADGFYPKLLDFGVSRAVDPESDLASVLQTKENAIVGTPHYMSPEQARGLRDLDQRADLWSAGVMLYELLSGRLPYTADVVGDVLIQVATTDAVPLAELRPDLAGPLTRVVDRALTRDRDERYGSARVMRAELLTAAARLASTEHGPDRSTRAGTLSVGTLSDVPTLEAGELRAALTETYEPGDSGLIDVDDLDLDADDDEAVAPSKAPEDAPPEGEDVFEATEREEAPPAAESGRPGLPLWAAVALVGLVVAGAIVLWRPATSDRPAREPAPAAAAEEEDEGPATVEVHLDGLPAEAEVRVDGQPVTLRPERLVLPRSPTPVPIEVRAGGSRWMVLHRPEEEGRYVVDLPAPRGDAPPPTSEEPEERERGASSILRDPGF